MKQKILQDDDLENKIGVLVGTRPSIIKMGTIIRELQKRKIKYFTIHAGQHYSYEMDQKFFEDLNLNKPDFIIQTTKNCKLHGEQTAEMLKGIEKILIKERPKLLLVCGDANFNLSGALAARKLHIKVGHVESGLRSGDWLMPEEHNRIMIDHISEYLFAPTNKAKQNAIKDNVKGKIFVTGNTIVDAVYQNLNIAENKSHILDRLKFNSFSYFLITVHREENVDLKMNLCKLIEVLKMINKKYPNTSIIYPIHPRSKNRLKQFGLIKKLYSIKNLVIIDPIGYLDFLSLLKNSKLVLTDSGGIQEEACIIQKPCITLRENTERPETVEIGANIITGLDYKKVILSIKKMLNNDTNWKNPYGKGKAAKKIVDICSSEVLI